MLLDLFSFHFCVLLLLTKKNAQVIGFNKINRQKSWKQNYFMLIG